MTKKDEVKEPQDGIEQTEEEVAEETEELGKSEEDFFPETDEEGEDGETSSDPEDNATSEEDDGTEGLADEISLDDFDDEEDSEPEKKSGVQRRIDKLVAEKKALEERLDRIESSQPSTTPEYSENQLRTAMSKAMEDGDPNLMWEIMDYRIKKAQKEAVSKYQKENEETTKAQQQQQKEWQSVVNEYSYLSDEAEPELYKGSHKDLNVGSTDSLVYKLASKLFLDPDRSHRYIDGGQRLAVSDAIRMILRKKNAKISSKENKKLKRQLAKEKKKSTVSSGKNVKAEKSKPRKKKSNLEEYMDERRKQKASLAGGL